MTDIAYSTALTEGENKLEFKATEDTHYLTLTDELRGASYEDLKKN